MPVAPIVIEAIAPFENAPAPDVPEKYPIVNVPFSVADAPVLLGNVKVNVFVALPPFIIRAEPEAISNEPLFAKLITVLVAAIPLNSTAVLELTSKPASSLDPVVA